MSELIAGIVPPMVTPFDEVGRIDTDALKRDVESLVNAGVHGLAVGGSTGEGHTLSAPELVRVTQDAISAADGAVPVIAGIIEDSLYAAAEKGRRVAELGVAALQVTPVHYLFRPSDDAMIEFFGKLADATKTPVIIYNVVPWSYLSPSLLTHILDSVHGVVAVKQSAEDMKLLADLLLMVGDRWTIMSAVDALLYPSFVLGAHGAIAAILTAAPALCVELWDAMQREDHAAAKNAHERLLPIWNAIKDDNLPANVKYAMSLQGRNGGKPRAPMPETSAAQATAIRAALASGGVTVKS